MATLSTGQGCTTPCSVVLDRRDVFSVTFAKAAFRSTTVDVVTRISASGAGDFGENIITAGAGAVVDAATGAVLEHSPNPVRVTLAPLEKPPARRPSGKVAS